MDFWFRPMQPHHHFFQGLMAPSYSAMTKVNDILVIGRSPWCQRHRKSQPIASHLITGTIRSFHLGYMGRWPHSKYCLPIIGVGSYGMTRLWDTGYSPFGNTLCCQTLCLLEHTLLPEAEQLRPQPHIFMADIDFPLCRDLTRPCLGTTHSSGQFNYMLLWAKLSFENEPCQCRMLCEGHLWSTNPPVEENGDCEGNQC